jgi:ketosteroid isomerase-like protein
MQKNKELITQFYTAFRQGDFATMQKSYHDEAHFNDPAFQNLNASEVRAMWQMLVTAAKDLKITFSDVEADETKGSCKWEAKYTFSKTGRSVHNIIKANFEFRDGKIIKHNDHFSFWRWSRQALGTSGLLLGWSNMLQKKVQSTARKGLEMFMKRYSK